MAINPVNPGPIYDPSAQQGAQAQRGSEASARNAREADDRPQASVPEANQRVSPNQGGSEGNGTRDPGQNPQRGRLDIYV